MLASLTRANRPTSMTTTASTLTMVISRDRLGGGIDSTGGKLDVGSRGIDFRVCSILTDEPGESEVTRVGAPGLVRKSRQGNVGQ
jgi:hypothetical protein